jgi:hypothetical protein
VNMMMPEKDDLLAKRKALKPEGEGDWAQGSAMNNEREGV